MGDGPQYSDRVDEIPPDAIGQDLDEMIKSRLKEMGLEEGDVDKVVEGAGGLHEEGGRWRLCPRCKSNIDMMTTVTGRIDGVEWPKILARGAVECPNCGCYGERFGRLAGDMPHEKLKTFKAGEIHNPFPWAQHYVQIGKSIIESLGLFPSDPRFDKDEQHWPRDLAAVILGGALLICSSMRRQVDRIAPPGEKDGKSRGSRSRDRRPQGADRRFRRE